MQPSQTFGVQEAEEAAMMEEEKLRQQEEEGAFEQEEDVEEEEEEAEDEKAAYTNIEARVKKKPSVDSGLFETLNSIIVGREGKGC